MFLRLLHSDVLPHYYYFNMISNYRDCTEPIFETISRELRHNKRSLYFPDNYFHSYSIYYNSRSSFLKPPMWQRLCKNIHIVPLFALLHRLIVSTATFQITTAVIYNAVNIRTVGTAGSVMYCTGST